MPAVDKTFVSYAREDKGFVQRLAAELRSAGVEVWIDIFDIPKGARWDDAVEEALERCHTLLIVLSPDSVASQNVKDELADALQRGKIVIPVLHKPCEIPLRMRRIELIDMTGDYNEGLAKLLAWLGKRIDSPSPPRSAEPAPAPPQRAASPPSAAPRPAPAAPFRSVGRPQSYTKPSPRPAVSNQWPKRLFAGGAIAAVLTFLAIVGADGPGSKKYAVEAVSPESRPSAQPSPPAAAASGDLWHGVRIVKEQPAGNVLDSLEFDETKSTAQWPPKN